MLRYMAARVVISTVLVFSGTKEISAQSAPRQDLPKFLGREVTIVEPELNADGFPKIPDARATVCVEGLPQRQCYTAPQSFWSSPTVAVVQLDKNVSALLFSAESYAGGSGWQIHFALLRPGTGKDLQDLFLSDMSVSNQSQHAFWNDFSISYAQIFVTADYVWGPEEGHYDKHRFIISAYVREPSFVVGDSFYYLEDRYMTVHKYDLLANADVLAAEKQEIIARLKRLKAETEPQQKARQ